MDTQISKRRLLMLLKLLQEQTDDEHPLSTAEIVEHFESRGILTDRRTVATDIDLLREAGYDVITAKGTQNRYFIGTRALELPEVKLLMIRDSLLPQMRFQSEFRGEWQLPLPATTG